MSEDDSHIPRHAAGLPDRASEHLLKRVYEQSGSIDHLPAARIIRITRGISLGERGLTRILFGGYEFGEAAVPIEDHDRTEVLLIDRGTLQMVQNRRGGLHPLVYPAGALKNLDAAEKKLGLLINHPDQLYDGQTLTIR